MDESNHEEDQDQDQDTDFERLKEERQREVDRLSLELLSNTRQYKKYIARNHPEERLKQEKDARRFAKLKPRVAGLFMELLEEYSDADSAGGSSDHSIELRSVFNECVQKMIQHIEWSDHNNHLASSMGEDEDMLFAHAYSHDKRGKSKRDEPSSASSDPFSFWGATIRKSSI